MMPAPEPERDMRGIDVAIAFGLAILAGVLRPPFWTPGVVGGGYLLVAYIVRKSR